jgi:hypothetical protein
LGRDLKRRSELSATERRRSRRYALRVGLYAALLGTVEWLAAGPIFPLGFHLLGGRVPAEGWMHFSFSMMVCGLIAAAYPYLCITLLSVRVFFPALLGAEAPDETDRQALANVGKTSHVFLATAAAVPMLAVLLVSLSDTGHRLILGTLSLVGVVGFLLAFWLYRQIHRDVGLLERAGEVRT